MEDRHVVQDDPATRHGQGYEEVDGESVAEGAEKAKENL